MWTDNELLRRQLLPRRSVQLMARTVRRSSGLVAISVIAVFLQALPFGGTGYTAPPGSGLTKKQRHGSIHNKDKLEGVYELPPEEEEPEAPEKPPMPERRVPYSMHIVTQLPQHKHLKEESNAQHYIEEKVVGALENFEDFIRHVEVHLQKSDNFHREKRPEKAKAKSSADVVDEEEDVIPSPPEKEWGHKVLMPYVFKATVTLVNHHKIALSNPEKHAQASLQEATDHMVDVLRKSLREEKNRMISNKRKQAESMPDDMDDMEAYNKELSDAVVEAKASEDDEAEEALYQRIEASK